MKKIIVTLLVLLIGICYAPGVQSATIGLYDWAFYIDGTTYEYSNGDVMPTTGALTNGLGTLTWSTSAAGSHNFIAFFDHEIDEAINTFFNEYGDTSGSPSAGQSWEIDEPGYVFGDIYNNVLSGSLDNFNGVPLSAPDDVSMALGWDFSLNSGESALISFYLLDTIDGAPFYLIHTDPDSQSSIYFASTLEIRGDGQPIPEPSTLLMVGSGLAIVVSFGRKRFLK
jgi:hypothetical protein